MESNSQIGFECVQPIESHALQVMEWRNDPQTLQMSYHSRPKVWEPFFREFIQDYFSLPDLPPLFILYEGKRAAFVRFHLVEDPQGEKGRRCCEISINVAPEYRNKGIGTLALMRLKDWVLHQGYDDIYAEVLKENTASQHLFLKAGYIELSDGDKQLETGELFAIKRYLCPLSDLEKPSKVFIIAEAGSNWRMGTPKRDMEMAKTLIEAAAEAGADAVKFQTFYPSTVYAQGAGQPDYLIKEGVQDDILGLFADLAMPHEMIPELAAYCREMNIEFMSTPFSQKDFYVVDPFVEHHKIASYEISHPRLIEFAAKSQKPLFLSTGGATEEEISWAVETFRSKGGGGLTLMQCTASYPAEALSMNLQVIPWLKYRFKVKVGLSDHSRYPTCAPIAAVALGASAIEKHFTLSNQLPGPDHAFALTPPELKEMVHAIRKTEEMLGSGVKIVDPAEEELREFAQRRVQAVQEIFPEDILREGINIDILRPGRQPQGVHPRSLNQMEGRKALRHIKVGEGVQRGDWDENT